MIIDNKMEHEKRKKAVFGLVDTIEDEKEKAEFLKHLLDVSIDYNESIIKENYSKRKWLFWTGLFLAMETAYIINKLLDLIYI